MTTKLKSSLGDCNGLSLSFFTVGSLFPILLTYSTLRIFCCSHISSTSVCICMYVYIYICITTDTLLAIGHGLF